MSHDELPVGWDEARIQRVLAHYEGQTEAEAADEDKCASEEAIEIRLSSPLPTSSMAASAQRMRVRRGGPVQPKFLIEEVDDPDEIARAKAQFARHRLNSDWLQAHWPELLPAARGKFIAVAGQEAFIADNPEEAWDMAEAAHPEDDGILAQYVRPERGPRIYANRG
jgi:hypothetical protein